MPKRMSDDDVMDYVYSKLFNDLDGIEAKSMFDSDDTGQGDGNADNAEPISESTGGVTITVKPLMKDADETGKPTDRNRDGEEDDEDEDGMEGISKISPLMAQLHGER